MTNDEHTRVRRALGTIGDAALPPPNFDDLRVADMARPPRPSHRVRYAVLAFSGVAAIIGIAMLVATDDKPDTVEAARQNEETPPTASPVAGGVITQFECPAGADCIRGFQVGAEVHEATCRGVKTELVSTTVLATGADPAWQELRSITGVDPEVMSAVRGSGCADANASEWTAVFGGNEIDTPEEALARARAECGVLVEPEPQCDQGGGGHYFVSDPYTEGYVYFDEYVDEVNAAVAAGNSPEVWRRDLREVVSRYLLQDRQFCAGDLYAFCRVGISQLSNIGGAAEVAVEGVYQTSTPAIDPPEGMSEEEMANLPERPLYDTYRVHVRAERLRGGETWWITAYEEDTVVQHGFDEEGRAGTEQAAQCCPLILSERGA